MILMVAYIAKALSHIKKSYCSFQVIGPVMVLRSAPMFDGSLSVFQDYSDNIERLIVSWEPNSFYDYGDVNDLKYYIAVGVFFLVFIKYCRFLSFEQIAYMHI